MSTLKGGRYGVNYSLGVDVIGGVGMGIGQVEAIYQIVLVELNGGAIGRADARNHHSARARSSRRHLAPQRQHPAHGHLRPPY